MFTRKADIYLNRRNSRNNETNKQTKEAIMIKEKVQMKRHNDNNNNIKKT